MGKSDYEESHAGSDLGKQQGMAKTMGLSEAMSVIIGCMIGAGVFIVGGDVFLKVQSPEISTLLWLVGGIVALCGGLTWAELGLMLPAPGGDVPYLDAAFPRPRKLLSYLYVVARTFGSHAMCTACLAFGCATLALAAYDPKLFMVVKKYRDGEGVLGGEWLALAMAAALSFVFIVLSFLIMAFSNVILAKSGTVLTVYKIILVVAFSICGFATMSNFLPNSTWSYGLVAQSKSSVKFDEPEFLKKAPDYGGALLIIFFCYDGFANLSPVIGELKNPRKDTFRALFLGCSIVAGLYLLYNVVILCVLPREAMDADFKLAGVFMSTMFAGNGSWLESLVFAMVVFSAFGAQLGTSFAASRVTYAAATPEVGALIPFSSYFGQLHPRFQTPLRAIVLHHVITTVWIALMFIPQVANAMFAGAMYINWIFYTASSLGLIWMRRKMPELHRPFRVPIVCPIVVALVGLFMIFYPFTVLSIPSMLPVILAFVVLIPTVISYFFYSKRTKVV